jgi:glycosyltransferase involved in cell wall biosynthesis
MTFFDMPEVHERLKVLYFRLFMTAAVRLADSLIFVSHSAQKDCYARLGSPHGLSTVIHHGKSEAFRPDLSPETIEQIRQKYDLPRRFILYIGTIEPRKNLTRLVSAFESVAEAYPDLMLVIAGQKGWMYESIFENIQRLKLESRVIFTGFVPEEDKPFLLSAATIFVYPSLYEGFGIPVLEALACGIPTVTSNTSSLPEVAGDAALMVDPKSVVDISNKIQLLLSDHVLRRRLIERSLYQSAKFTWESTAAQTCKAYLEAMADKHK